MPDFDERIELIETAATVLLNQYNTLMTDEELDDVVTEIFDEIREIETRIITLHNNLKTIEQIVDSLQAG
jgi:hypothetical protein